MIETVTLEGSTWAAPPARFEAGTPHIAGAIGLAKAAEFIMGLGLEHIAALEAELLRYATEQMGAIDGLRVIGTAPEKAGILSELRRREYYEKPTQERKRKKAAAVKRHMKRQARQLSRRRRLY